VAAAVVADEEEADQTGMEAGGLRGDRVRHKVSDNMERRDANSWVAEVQNNRDVAQIALGQHGDSRTEIRLEERL